MFGQCIWKLVLGNGAILMYSKEVIIFLLIYFRDWACIARLLNYRHRGIEINVFFYKKNPCTISLTLPIQWSHFACRDAQIIR